MHKHNINYIISVCSIASLAGLILGYDASVISGAIEPLTEYFDLTPAECGLAVSSAIIGCILGAYFVGYLADKYGRRTTLMLANILLMISAVGSAITDVFSLFILYRVLGGIAIGMVSTVTPLYIAEFSPKDIRGRMLGLQQLVMVGGQLIVYIVNFTIAKGMIHEWVVEFGWRWMLASVLLPCVLFMFLSFLIPESPRWNVMKNHDQKAMDTLTKISNQLHAQHLFNEIKASFVDSAKVNKIGFFSVLSNAKSRYITLIGCTIAVLQQLTGINILLYYAPSLLKNITGSNQESLFQTIFLGIALFVGVFIALRFIDNVGRVKLLRLGSIGCCLCLIISALTFYFNIIGYLPITLLVIFVLIYAISWSLGAWLLISEIFPNRIRAVAMGISFSAMYLSNALIAQVFPMMNQNDWLMATFNGGFPLLICAASCLFGYWFIGRFLPETKGISLEKIEPVMLSKSKRFAAKS